VDECAELIDEIERLRSYLVDLTTELGDLLHAEVLQVSCRLDERITEYYRLVQSDKSSGVKIA
jgi:hypothetical protein